MNPLLSAAVGSILRWALALGAGYLVKAGIWTGSDAQTYTAAASMALLSLLWSLYQKWKLHQYAVSWWPWRRVAVGLLVLLAPTTVRAQVDTEPLAWAPQHRALADGLSTALVGVQAAGTVYQDVKTWRAGDHTPTLRSGCAIGLSMALTQTLTRVFPEVRPDGSDTHSGFSSHSGATAALAGWRFEFGVPLAVMTGLLRDSANKHHLWGPGQAKDIPWGWAIGAGSQALCSALIR